MSDTELKVGDVVKLKSGGSTMTVVDVSDTLNGKVLCEWFVDGKVESRLFAAAALYVEPTE